MPVNVKVGLIGALDMLKFKNMSKVREAAIQAAPANEITADYAINNNAKALHPDYQKLVVSRIIDHYGAGAKTFVLERSDGGRPAYFRAGQYLSLKLKIDDSVLSRPYSICSAPKDALAVRRTLHALVVHDHKPVVLGEADIRLKPADAALETARKASGGVVVVLAAAAAVSLDERGGLSRHADE